MFEIIQSAISAFNILTIIIGILTLTISLTAIFLSQKNLSKSYIVKSFNKIYDETFDLRNRVENIVGAFYYETDKIISNPDAEHIVMSYITEVENLFFSAGKSRGLSALISYPLYERMLALLPYIIHKRKAENNPELHKLYENFLIMMQKCKKIRKRMPDNKTPLCWVGIRQSDAKYADFQKTICIFADTRDDSYKEKRTNQNAASGQLVKYFEDKIAAADSKFRFCYYNQNSAYLYSREIRDRSICLNSERLLEMLNDKYEMKCWLDKNGIDIIKFVKMTGSEICRENLKATFGDGKYVVQRFHGGGGVGTFLYDPSSNSETVFQPNQSYLVSQYIAQSISVNVHIVVGKKQNVITPASVQIIETIANQLSYRGADFIAFREQKQSVKNKILENALKIANLLRGEGYLGIAGIDFIVDSLDNVYCAEINPRFQASSVLVDRYLSEKYHSEKYDKSEIPICKNLFEMNCAAFNGGIACDIGFYDEINYSCYYYYDDLFGSDNFKHNRVFDKLDILKSIPQIQVDEDGIADYTTDSDFDSKSYLYRAIFPFKIARISPEKTLWISDNVKSAAAPSNDIELKIALLNQGVRLPNDDARIKSGVYSSADLKLFKPYDFFVNCPRGVNYSEISPFSYDLSGKKLMYYSEYVADAEIDFDYFKDAELENGSRLKEIVYFATDRLKINAIQGCEYKNLRLGCKFCNVGFSERRHTIAAIEQAFKTVKAQNELLDKTRHFLIGGGTDLKNGRWEYVEEIARYLKREFPDKSVALMSVPPEPEILPKLKSAGIDEAAFNIEIRDDELSKSYMPGKAAFKRSLYMTILSDSVKIFGKGNVRSALMVGLEKSENIFSTVEELCKRGVQPCLSVFRPLPDTPMSGEIPPPNDYLLKLYNKCERIAESYGMEIGPSCKACRNNMLAL